jgi:nucleoid-associated protein YgaU
VATALIPTAAHAASLTGPWACIVEHESSGVNQPPGLPGEGSSSGYLQIEDQTWAAYGGLVYGPHASDATEAEQFAVAMRVLAAQGPSAWTTNAEYGCGLTRGTPNPFGGATPSPARSGSGVAPHARRHAPVSTSDSDDAAVTSRPRYHSAVTGESYTVRSGDWLEKIAREHHVAGGWQTLYAANRGVIGNDANLIYPGEVIHL